MTPLTCNGAGVSDEECIVDWELAPFSGLPDVAGEDDRAGIGVGDEAKPSVRGQQNHPAVFQPWASRNFNHRIVSSFTYN